MKIKTELLKEIVSKVINGASNNKMLPITSLIGVDYKDSYLTLTTTDGSTQFIIKQKLEVPAEEDYEFYTVVNAEQFSKLVSKTTKEYIELENTDNSLNFKGNGTYELELALNEDGQLVKFADVPTEGFDVSQMINLKDLQDALITAKASLAKTMELPCLTGYYIGKNIITTDRQLVCKLDKKLVEEPILISSQMAELLLLVDLAENDLFELNKLGSQLIFTTNKYIIAGKELEGKEIYNENIVKAVTNLTSLEYTGEVQVNKQELLDILDRMNLFVSPYDKNAVNLVFTKDGLQVKSMHSNAIEVAEIKSEKDVAEYTCTVDIEMLKNQIQSLNLDSVTIQYGSQKSIQLKEGNTTLVIALLEVAE